MLYGNQHVWSMPLSSWWLVWNTSCVILSNTKETSVQLQTGCAPGLSLPDIMQVAERSGVQLLTGCHSLYYCGQFSPSVDPLLRLDVLLTLSRFCLLTGALPNLFYRCAPVPISLWFIISSVLNNAINVTLMSSTQFVAPLPACLPLWLVTWDGTQSLRHCRRDRQLIYTIINVVLLNRKVVFTLFTLDTWLDDEPGFKQTVWFVTQALK